MIRETKYRAWDRVRLTWVYFYMLDGQQPVPLYDGNFLWKDLDPWQQFTGRKDFNGKDIFEGDILKAHGRDADPAVVTWNEKLMQWDARISLWAFHEPVVIGSLNETPELLK